MVLEDSVRAQLVSLLLDPTEAKHHRQQTQEREAARFLLYMAQGTERKGGTWDIIPNIHPQGLFFS